ncbi:hypothetical protein HMPREF2883_00090 [Actinomyces sp. HMSC075C01]|uniref:YbjN domain-containing protein n=1 Tax=Actinomyces oris TaxID=544580 RepID=A0A1Q8VRA2_9ACTO|nr:hypothetical protein HMPREF2883_00090 [Actinomyces sp. HMSC075C01]OLO50598.1 hypothetical protein BKH27_13185 [Actinomyces oris]
MSPRKKPTAKTRQSTTPRKPAAPRPTKVTLSRVKKILICVDAPVMVSWDGALVGLTDNSALRFQVLPDLLTVSIQWHSKAPFYMLEALCILVESWNASPDNDDMLRAYVVPSPEDDSVLLCAASTLPVSAGMTDDQLGHYLREAIDACMFFEEFLEETFPQTRFDDFAKDAGIQIPDSPEELLTELGGEPAEAVSQLVERARVLLDNDMDSASMLLTQASRIAEANGLDPVELGIHDVFAATMEKVLGQPEMLGSREEALGRAMLEALKAERDEPDHAEGDESDGPNELAEPNMLDDGQAEAAIADLFGLKGLGRVPSRLPALTLPLVVEALNPDYDFLEKDDAVIIPIGDDACELVVGVEGTELIVTARWSGMTPLNRVLASMAANDWNVVSHVMGVRTGFADRMGEAISDAATAGQAPPQAGDSVLKARSDTGGDIIARASWCLGAGVSKAQIVAMVDAAAAEVEDIGLFLRGEVGI